MKNLIVFGLVAVCSVLLCAESAVAASGGVSGGNKSRARMIFKSTVPAGGIGIAIYVRVPGEPIPTTLGGFRSKLIYTGPGEIRQTSKLKNGTYEIYTVDAAITAGPDNTPVAFASVPLLGSTTTTVNGFDRTINVNAGGIIVTN